MSAVEQWILRPTAAPVARGLRRLAIFAFVLACGEVGPQAGAETVPSCDAPGVREVVERLGERLNRVSLLAADTIFAREIREAYAQLVTPDLLDRWIAQPAAAPGREVSSPWPERIEIVSVEAASDGSCTVQGEIVLVTSDELTRGAARRDPVTLRVVHDGDWRISAFESSAPPSPETNASAR